MNKRISEVLKTNSNKIIQHLTASGPYKEAEKDDKQIFKQEEDEFKIEYTLNLREEVDYTENTLGIKSQDKSVSLEQQPIQVQERKGEISKTKKNQKNQKKKVETNIKQNEQEDEDYFNSTRKKKCLDNAENDVYNIFKSKWKHAEQNPKSKEFTSSDGIYLNFSTKKSVENFKKESGKTSNLIEQNPPHKNQRNMADDEVSLDSDIEIPDF